MSICFKEKIKLPHEKIQQLIISTDNDVRQILHQLELFKEGKSQQAFDPRKDLRFGPWDVIRKVFLKSEHAKMSIHDKNGLFFQDYNIGPLFVQENYPKWTPAAAGYNYFHFNPAQLDTLKQHIMHSLYFFLTEEIGTDTWISLEKQQRLWPTGTW